MVQNPRNVVVIGAGTMGSGIAAHLANLGLEVTLLDISDESVRAAFERAKKARPPHFYVPETAESVRTGSIDIDVYRIKDADWVCEAIAEKPEAKKALFALIEPMLRDDAFVSTNTSGLQIGLLCEGRSESFRRRFLGTHFFNPPRYLKLLELIPTPDTDPQVVTAMSRFLEDGCARRVVVAKDTPGFIANRYGMWCMYHAVHCTERLGLTIEQVDAITGPFLGRPRSGSFRLNDLVGLDIMQDIASNLTARCPDDPYIKHLQAPKSLQYLLDKGWIGEKAGQGYYRREGKELMSLDLQGLGYRMRIEPDIPSLTALSKKPLGDRVREGMELNDDLGAFLRAYVPLTLEYAEFLKEEISHNVEDFDRVMKWGFGWEAGPFEMADLVGASKKSHYSGGKMLDFGGEYVAVRSEPQYRAITDFPVTETHDNFTVRDMGDGVKAVCTTTKMGVFTVGLVGELKSYLESGKLERFVLTSESRSYSAGFDLQFLLDAAHEKRLADVDRELTNLQSLGRVISQIPSVAAVFGHCLGGGFEMATSCSIVAAHPETQIGLPEARVGLVPGGGGAAHMRQRHGASAKSLTEAAKTLILATVSTNADDARKYGFLRRSDVTVYHPDRLWTEAKKLALSAVATPEDSWSQVAGPVGGMVDQAFVDLLKKGEITEHDHAIGEHIKHILVRSNTFEEALDRERAAFEALLVQGLTVSRIKHMLETGKPLRN
ncbi:MAG: enoyl-CoA hydratase/isomerase family protein [Armatimonadetes bacterium]|nr:enoyl-CoA hydratase/isomerase family protein [Armatimonadota bacterium]